MDVVKNIALFDIDLHQGYLCIVKSTRQDF